jgi:hypothetical protein
MKYEITLLRRKVWVRNKGMMYDRAAITEGSATEITDWVTLMGIGYRVAYDRWQLDSTQAVMMFMLRWN